MKEKDYIVTSAGVKMPKIIYGTAWKKERTTTLVELALRSGFRGIDTACQPRHYSEALVGEALLNMQHEGIKREDVFIQTKFTPVGGQDPDETPYDANATLSEQVKQSFTVSKQNLHADYIDSLVLHSPYDSFEDLMEVWHTMESFVDNGEVGQLGISNCYSLEVLQYLYTTSKIKPAILQNRFHAITDYDKEIRQWCDTHNVIYQSFWSLTANPKIISGETLDVISQKYQTTPAEIWFAFLRENSIVPLVGTSSSQHMLEDLSSLELSLSADELEQIQRLL
ncbi:aldo/keto reductase [Sulfurovum sp.]|uniref:aldo/keto reductase family protein n=1 Tax=Sulfurovum sp. TaxID=1969726 RepID=UPI00286819BE|nr:aldo/keto reductase [Sulfurovum sp.]